MRKASNAHHPDKAERNKKRFKGKKRGPHTGDPNPHLKGHNPTLSPRIRRQELHLRDVSDFDDEDTAA